MTSIPVFTIGYGNRTLMDFINILRKNQIEYLIDVRSKPYSKFNPDFSKSTLEQSSTSSGIKYVYMGDALGGQPDNQSSFTPDGKVDYEKLKEKPAFQNGIKRLVQAWKQNIRVALLCSEIKPEMCHRSKLIGVTLLAEGIEVIHIDENEDLVSQEQVLLRLTNGQLSFPGLVEPKYTSRKSYAPKDKLDE